jgi:hypothetical protein
MQLGRRIDRFQASGAPGKRKSASDSLKQGKVVMFLRSAIQKEHSGRSTLNCSNADVSHGLSEAT